MEKLKIRDKIIMIFICLLPFIDLITSICTWHKIDFSLGLILKGIFFIYALGYLLKNYSSKKIFLPLVFYGLIYLTYLFRYQQNNLLAELINIIKIFYLPVLILFFSTYENKNLTKKTLFTLFITYALLYLIPFFLGIGHNANEIAENRELYLSYFYIGNELANVFIMLLPIAVTYLLECHNYILKIFIGFIIVMLLILMGTKAFYLSFIIILSYFIMKRHKQIGTFVKKNYLKTLVTVMVFLIAIVVYIPHLDFTKSLKNTLDYYEVDSLKEVLTWENVDNVLLNSRLTYLKNINTAYHQGTSLEKLMGLGKSQIASLKEIEMDIFDIFYSIGIIGTLFYLTFFIYVLKKSPIKKEYRFSFILLIIISCFTGHVLISPFTSTILAILFIASKNKQNLAKDILLVSNMYPSQKYPHYGIFVQSTYEQLINANYNIDLVTMSKTDNILIRLGKYIKFGLVSFFKVIFNNYNYIYVHFISHSTIGVFLPYLTSKNTQLVLNVHGNDVIPDTQEDEKNIKRSKIFLKKADKVVVPSAYFATELVKRYQLEKNKITIYPSSGIDFTKFYKMPKTKALKQAKLNSKYKYFGYVSRIEKNKGYDVLIEAINELKKQKKLSNIKFLIVGSGREEEQLNNLITKYKLNKYIIRQPLVNQEELNYIYNSLEALIYPTRRESESLGLTGLEAMACETLVIGSNKYGPSSYLNNTNSLIFNPESKDELVSKILEVLKMKSQDKKAILAQAYAKSQEYSQENTQKILLKIFEK